MCGFSNTCFNVNSRFRIPRDFTPLEVALGHYRELIHTSGLSSLQFADMISQQRGFLGDHECVSPSAVNLRPIYGNVLSLFFTSYRYPFLQELAILQA